MKTIPRITDYKDIKGKYVLVRGGLNVPVENGIVINEFRIERIIPTLKYLVDGGARLLLIGHIGRDPKETLKPIFNVLKESFDITWAGELLGSEVRKMRDSLKNGQILMLENLRSDEREKANNESFAKELVSLADVYVNEAFSNSHRKHASIVGVPQYIPSFAGINFLNECKELTQVMEPEHPSLFILGGAKFDTKMPLIEKYLEEYSHVFVGGALANDFYKAKGLEIGTSLVSDIEIADNPISNNSKVLLPVDVKVQIGSGERVTTPDDVQKNESILDLGPATLEMLKPYIEDAETILWNGPMGNYENDFEEGTVALANLIAKSNAYSVVGGGDTIASIKSLGLSNEFGFISTGGGAMLKFLEHGTLPAIEALKVDN